MTDKYFHVLHYFDYEGAELFSFETKQTALNYIENNMGTPPNIKKFTFIEGRIKTIAPVEYITKVKVG